MITIPLLPTAPQFEFVDACPLLSQLWDANTSSFSICVPKVSRKYSFATVVIKAGPDFYTITIRLNMSRHCKATNNGGQKPSAREVYKDAGNLNVFALPPTSSCRGLERVELIQTSPGKALLRLIFEPHTGERGLQLLSLGK